MGEDKCIAHDEVIKRNTEDISVLYKLLNGLPQKVENMIDILREIKEQNQKIDEKYVSKEVLNVIVDNLEEKLEKLQKFQIWVYLSIISGAGAFIMFLLNLVSKHV